MTSYEVTVVGKPEFQPYAQASCKDRRPLKELHNCIALTADTVHYCPTFDSSLATEIVGDKTNETYHKVSSVLHPEYPVYSRHHQHIKDIREKWRQVIHDSLHIISLVTLRKHLLL